MSTHRSIVLALLGAAAHNLPVVVATVVRVTGSSYGGVGSRMVIGRDGSTIGIVSGGCLESDLAEHARQVHTDGRAKVVSYDTRADDDAAWGLGLGCNGLIDVLLEPMSPSAAGEFAALMQRALNAPLPSVLATIIESPDESQGIAGAHSLFAGDSIAATGDWGDQSALDSASLDAGDAPAAGRRGFVRDYNGVQVAFEVVHPAIRLVICGSGPDVIPLVHFGMELGWDLTVVDHRPVEHAHPERFPGATVVECATARDLAKSVTISSRTAAVVMSHHFARDTEYASALINSEASYIGILGPRTRSDRMRSEIGGSFVSGDDVRIFAPVGLDVGGDGPDAIALSIIAEVSAVMARRGGRHLRERAGSLHSDRQTGSIAAVILAAGASTRFGSPKQLYSFNGQTLLQRAVATALAAGAARVVVVVGSSAEQVSSAIHTSDAVTIVLNENWATGMASSLALGLSKVTDYDGALVMLSDQPLIDPNSIGVLTDRFREGHRLVASAYAGTIGVPAVFGHEYLGPLMILEGDHGAGHWLREHRDEVTVVPLEAARIDIDTPADLDLLNHPTHHPD